MLSNNLAVAKPCLCHRWLRCPADCDFPLSIRQFRPDGLDRVSQDLKFQDRAVEDAPAKKLPFYAVFEEYALRGVPEELLPIGRFDRNASNIWLGLGNWQASNSILL